MVHDGLVAYFVTGCVAVCALEVLPTVYVLEDNALSVPDLAALELGELLFMKLSFLFYSFSHSGEFFIEVVYRTKRVNKK